MNQILKNLISGITAISLSTAVLSIPVAKADEPVNTPDPAATIEPSPSVGPTSTPAPAEPATDRKLYFDFLGRESNSADLSKLTGADINSEFWVGIGVDKINDLSLFTNGVYSLEVTVEYDPDYLVPFGTQDSWKTELEKGNINNEWWNSDKYEIIAETEADKNAIKNKAGSFIDTGGDTKMCTVCIMFKEGETFENARFTGCTDDTKQYLIKLPFTLKKAPLETDANQKPIVLDIVRGPEALNIGSGSDGKTPYSEWHISGISPTGTENMHTLFKTNNKLSLFGEDGAITDIVPIKTKTDSETDDTRYILSQDKSTLLGEGFLSSEEEYYLQVSNDVKKLKFEISSSGEPIVNANGVPITSTGSGGIYTTEEFDLLELNRDIGSGGEVDGFNNTVTVEVGGTTYTIHIRQLLKPKIELKPGNGPYGLIEAMSTKYLGTTGWDDAKIEQAKTSFINRQGSFEPNRFKVGSGFVPTGAIGKENIIYTIDAWEKSMDSDKNMDRNVYAIFAYNRRSFEDTGFEAYDSLGQPVADVSITRSITVGKMSDKNITSMQTTSLTPMSISVTGQASDYTFNEFSSSDICPGKYEMVYSFTDPITGETVKNARDDSELITNEEKVAENLKRRYIVYVWNRGDANMSTAIETGDQSTISELIVNRINFTGIPSDVVALYKFRMADANMSTAMETGDQSTISELIVRKITNPEFYR